MWRTWWKNSASAQTNGFTIVPNALNDIHKDDKIIVLLGRTGVGKSNFIERLANNKLNISSFGLERGTNDFTLYRIRNHPTWKNRIVLADTPGFQDVTISEYSALKAIRDWIKTSNAPPLHALFYLDRITDPFKGGDKPCWDLFTVLCGEGQAKRACLVTTAWDLVGHQEGVSEATAKRTQLAAEKKRGQLRTHWEKFLGKGLQFFEFQNTTASANEILNAILYPVPTHRARFVLEDMNKTITKPPVQPPVFCLLLERYRIIALGVSNAEDDLQGPLTHSIQQTVQDQLQNLRGDRERLRSEILEFDEGPSALDRVDEMVTQPSPEVPLGDHDNPPEIIPETPTLVDDDKEEYGGITFLVCGATGVGKTTFIRSFTDFDHLDASQHDLSAGTKGIVLTIVRLRETGLDLVLIDTPGFDDSARSNAEVLTTICEYLERVYRRKKLLTGVIYLQRITDIRYDAGASSALNIFKKLYGADGYDKLACVTTMWNNIRPEMKYKYAKKEDELKKTTWCNFLKREHPALVARFDASDDDTSRTSALNVVSGLLRNSTGGKLRLQIQRELVDEGKKLPRTEAGRAAFTLQEMAKYYLREIEP